MESASELIQKLVESTKVAEKRTIVAKLKHVAADSGKGLVVGNVKKLFTTLENLIKNPNTLLAIDAIELVSLLVCGADPEIEAQLAFLQPTLITALSSDNEALRGAIKDCELNCLKKYANCESVLAALNKFGMEGADETTRIHSAEIIIALAKQHATLVDDSKNGSELLKTLHALVTTLLDISFPS